MEWGRGEAGRLGGWAVIATCTLLLAGAVPAAADPEPAADPGIDAVDIVAAPVQPGPDAEAVPDLPADPAADAVVDPEAPEFDGMVVSAPAKTSVAPDGWTLTVGAKDETLRHVAPLTTALSSRDYEVSGVFNGSVSGPDDGTEPRGVLEVGYQIGCGIDMSTSQGVTMSGSIGAAPSIGILGLEFANTVADGFLPQLSMPISGGIAIGLKPGIVHIVPVTKKEYKGADPWVSINGFHVKIDGCVGESFIRSYAVLTRSTDVSDAIQAYYGTTKKV